MRKDWKEFYDEVEWYLDSEMFDEMGELIDRDVEGYFLDDGFQVDVLEAPFEGFIFKSFKFKLCF